MTWLNRAKIALGLAQPQPQPQPPAPVTQPLREAASAQGHSNDDGWRRLTGDGRGGMNDRDLEPMAQERMQKLAEYLNCDRSALSRELSRMQHDGLIETWRSSFKLLDKDRLKNA